MERERFGSRLGFILISAGCAIGLGNVWRFPYVVGQHGGAAFILIYLLFLIVFGVPIMTMEFAVGRASQCGLVCSFKKLEPHGSQWHWIGWLGLAGNYLLMMFYTTVAGWMFSYFIKMLTGSFVGNSPQQIVEQFVVLKASPLQTVGFMLATIVLGFLICSFGLKKGVEKINKVMMLALLAIISILALRAVTLPGATEGLRYYLVPDFSRMADNWGEIVFAAMGQAFFTLSIGMGSMAIFGSYIGKERRLTGEAISVAALDTFVAIVAGLIVIPSCFAYGVDPASGPGLLFETLPRVFNSMAGGRIWGALFFLFMIFAAMSTVTAVFENLNSFYMDMWGWSRRKSCVFNAVLVSILALPCAFGFNLLSDFTPFGGTSTVMDLEDFIISNNILPLGSLAYVLFCTWNKKGWGWNAFLGEANTGLGLRFPGWMRVYCKYVLPVILLLLWGQGIYATLVN